MRISVVVRPLLASALCLAGGLLTPSAAVAQDSPSDKKVFYCYAFMNPMDGRGSNGRRPPSCSHRRKH